MLLRFALVAEGNLILSGSGAHANHADFTINNKTGYQIDELYVSRHFRSEWGLDRMGDHALADGESKGIKFPHESDTFADDIKEKYHGENYTAERGDTDLCLYETITSYWDKT